MGGLGAPNGECPLFPRGAGTSPIVLATIEPEQNIQSISALFIHQRNSADNSWKSSGSSVLLELWILMATLPVKPYSFSA